jgi:rhodanese-related sulfurtransferase
MLLVGFGLASPASAQDAPLEIKGATTVNADKVIGLIESNAKLIIIDNRRMEDFKAGHIENAKRILDTDLSVEKLAELVPQKTQPVLFYCNGVKCGRAAKAVELAVKEGYTTVYYYALGMDEWKAKGLPLSTVN